MSKIPENAHLLSNTDFWIATVAKVINKTYLIKGNYIDAVQARVVEMGFDMPSREMVSKTKTGIIKSERVIAQAIYEVVTEAMEEQAETVNQ